LAQRRPTPRALPRGKAAAKKAPAAKKATAIAKKVPAAAKKVLAAAKKAVPGKKRAATRAPVTKAPAAKRAATAKKGAAGPKSASPRGEKLARAVSAAAGAAPRKDKSETKPPASPDTLEAKPAPMPPAAPRGEKLAGAVHAAAAQSPDTPKPPGDAPAELARPAGPSAGLQYLVLTGGSPFLRAIGYIQRAGGEPLPDFINLSVAKMASLPLPTEPGTYEFRFHVRNGTGDFKLAQRNEKGATKNVHSYEVDPKDSPQTWRFTIP
jgi:hypothetical protein